MMTHQRFFGSNIKRSQHQMQQKKEAENVPNKLFANSHLRNLQLPKQLTQQFCMDLDYGLIGLKIETRTPSKQAAYIDPTKIKLETTPIKQDQLKFQYNQHYACQELSNFIKIRRCQPDKAPLNPIQQNHNQNQLQTLNLKRKRASSFAEDRCISPDPKYKRSRLNSIVFRNFQNNSARLEDSYLEIQ